MLLDAVSGVERANVLAALAALARCEEVG